MDRGSAAVADDMSVEIRLGAGLQAPGRPARSVLTLPAGATVADAIAALRDGDPGLAEAFGAALPVVGGAHVGPGHPLADGDRLALVLPVAGGAPIPHQEAR